jgi:light-harvesting protein B-800-850 alpha chain
MAENEIARPQNPQDDWKVWTVADPHIWLIPILITVLGIALAVHAFVLNSAKYNFLAG